MKMLPLLKLCGVLWVVAALLSACSFPQRGDPAFRSGHYIVRSQDTLYSIAWRYDLVWQDLASWNQIAPPYTIYPGQQLRMNPPGTRPTAVAARSSRGESAPPPAPRPGIPTATTTASTAGSRPTPQASPPTPAPQRTTPPVAASTPAPARTAPAAPVIASAPTGQTATVGGLTWQWPTEGQVIRTFSTQTTGKKGIAIAGVRGQPVRAAAAGRVVYSGSGLVGYGKLIIIKHNDRYLSAYAHNDALLVNEGANVVAGQQVAQLGDSGTDRVMLHFEIRRDGQPVDPLQHLPRR